MSKVVKFTAEYTIKAEFEVPAENYPCHDTNYIVEVELENMENDISGYFNCTNVRKEMEARLVYNIRVEEGNPDYAGGDSASPQPPVG